MKLLNEGTFAVLEEAETEKDGVLEDMSSILKPFESFVATGPCLKYIDVFVRKMFTSLTSRNNPKVM